MSFAQIHRDEAETIIINRKPVRCRFNSEFEDQILKVLHVLYRVKKLLWPLVFRTISHKN